MDSLFSGVFLIDTRLATLNLKPGKVVYNERLVKKDGTEYRFWEPFRSKLAAAIKKGLQNFPFTTGSKILYLGASTGTTISHLSDIIGEKGEIYAVEIAPMPLKSLIKLSEERVNIIPIHGDARKPGEYHEVGTVDVIYQDVAQADQSDILIKNADRFLKKGSIAMIAIKSQSIDVTKKPRDVFEIELKRLEAHFEVLEKYELEPFDKNHLFVVVRKK